MDQKSNMPRVCLITPPSGFLLDSSKVSASAIMCVCGSNNCSIPLGLCHCGCGEKTSISTQSITRKGYVKGLPRRFLPGHNMPRPVARNGCICGKIDCSIPYGYCHCGCGNITSLYRDGDANAGIVAGSPRKFAYNHNEIRWSEEEIQIIRENLNKVSYKAIAAMLPGRTIDAIKRRATLQGFSRGFSMEGSLYKPTSLFQKTSSGLRKAANGYGRFPRRTLNENFFGEISLISSYWAGFIAADGYIKTSPRHELRIGLQRRDMGHLQNFCADIGFDGKISEDAKQCCHVTICAAYQFTHDLDKIFNIRTRKTFTLEPPHLSGSNALAYSIGVIDGDGCWATSQAHRINDGVRRLHLIVVGTKPLLKWLVSIWNDAGANIGDPNVSFRRNCWRLSISGPKAKAVANLLDEIETPKLERKWRVARGEAIGQEV